MGRPGVHTQKCSDWQQCAGQPERLYFLDFSTTFGAILAISVLTGFFSLHIAVKTAIITPCYTLKHGGKAEVTWFC